MAELNIDGNIKQSTVTFRTDRVNKGEWKRAAYPKKLSVWIEATLNAEIALLRAKGYEQYQAQLKRDQVK